MPIRGLQVNTRAAEVLYAIVRDWAAADKDELILDVCCGTGTIGLCMSSGLPPLLRTSTFINVLRVSAHSVLLWAALGVAAEWCLAYR